MRDAAIGWVEHNAPRLSAALAFYTILSVSPLLVIATAIVGAVFGDAGASDQHSFYFSGSSSLKSLPRASGTILSQHPKQNGLKTEPATP